MEPQIFTPQPNGDTQPSGPEPPGSNTPTLPPAPQPAVQPSPTAQVGTPLVNRPLPPASGNLPIAVAPTDPSQTSIGQQAGGVVPGQIAPIISSYNSKPKVKKRIFIILGVAIVLVTLASAFVFGYYLPNQPERVWATGINRSGEALNKFVDTALEKSKLDAFQKSDMTASLDVKYIDGSYKGTFNLKFDTTKANGGLEINAQSAGQPDQNLSAKYLSEIPEGSQYPNIYFQLSGLKTFGLTNYLPGLLDYDGKWIAVDAEYLKSLGGVQTAEETAEKQMTSDDFAELARAATSVTKEYIFSTNPDRAVFERKSFVGKEKVDGLDTYHYTVGLNKNNLKLYCKAMVNRISATSAYKKLPYVDEKTIDEDKAGALKACDNDATYDYLTKQTYEMWIETKYKIIHKIRIPDAENKANYVDIGQVYKGGDDVSLFVKYHGEDNKIDGKLTLDTNLKTNISKVSLVISSKEKDNPFDVTVSLEAKPYSDEINVEKPAGAIPIEEVLNSLGFNSNSLGDPADESDNLDESLITIPVEEL